MSSSVLNEKDLLRSAGLRATPQRVALLSLLRVRGRPQAVDELVRAGKGKFDATTAYRTLEVLEANKLARRIDLGQGRATFEFADSHHHHAICTACGLVRDLDICTAPSLEEASRAASFSRIERHSLEFFGICKSCARGSGRAQR